MSHLEWTAKPRSVLLRFSVVHRCPESDRADPDNGRESDAREILAAHLDGTLVIWDDNSQPMMWDYCLVGVDGNHLASVEVTRSIDQELKEFYIHREVAGPVWDAPHGLNTCWTVILDRGTNPLTVDVGVLHHLLLETQALGFESVTRDSFRPLRDMARELGLIKAWERHPCEEAPHLHIDTTSEDWTGGEQATASFLRVAKRNREKLEGAPAPRHLVVWIEAEDLAATFAMIERPPDMGIETPRYVDVGWVACGSGRTDTTALWRTEGGESWQVLATL